MKYRLAFLCLAAAAPLFLSSCATVDLVTGRETSNFFSLKEDIDMGKEGLDDFVKVMTEEGILTNKDAPQVKKLNEMMGRIVKANNLTNFPFSVTLFHTNIVNAMALPGGQLLAFDGLWDKKDGIVKDDDEIAAIFGHEIAHVTCRHSTEELTRQLPAQLLLGGVALYAEIKEDEDLQDIVLGAFLVWEGLLVPRYSRIDETEADSVGMMYMARAGYDPAAAVRLWRRLDDTEGSGWPILSIFSTHPPHSRRYKDLEKALPEAVAEFEKTKPKQ